MTWTPAARRAAVAARQRTRDGYRELVQALLRADPSLSTDVLAVRLGYDRSTIRRWRRQIRESEGAAKINP